MAASSQASVFSVAASADPGETLPLVKCVCCRRRTVIRLVSKSKENPGRVFFKCPNHKVLTKPKNALGKQYIKLFEMNDVKLHFTEKALRLIAERAISKNTGARGLRSILESILTETMYEIPEIRMGKDKIDAVVVDEESVGSVNQHGFGAKILFGKGSLDLYLDKHKKSSMLRQLDGEPEIDADTPSRVASM